MQNSDLDALFLPVDTKEDQTKDVLKRVAPHNFEAEAALLGALLNNNASYEYVSDLLFPEHFADTRHARIYDACSKLIERGQLANPVTLKSYFKQDKDLQKIGGVQYLAELSNNLVSVINVSEYGKILYDLFLRRSLIQIGEETINEAYQYDLDTNASNKIESAEEKLFSLATLGAVKNGFISFDKVLNKAILKVKKAFQNKGHIVGVTTGLHDVDQNLGGLHPSDFLILAGRPSMGKTALAMNIAFNAALACKDKEISAIAVFSLEMSSEQLATRLISQVAQVSVDNMRRGNFTGEEFERIVIATHQLSNIELYIDDTPSISVSMIRTRSRRLQRKHGLVMIIVDYLQLLTPPINSRDNGRVQEISAITRYLKAIAKELDVPILALSQLSRAVEQREDKRPQLSDLRESGSIEQDSDVVMFIYREQYYLERSKPIQRIEESDEKFSVRYQNWEERVHDVFNSAELIIAKQRHGPLSNIRLYFDGKYTKFGNMNHIEK